MNYNLELKVLNQILILLSNKGYLDCPDYELSITFEEVGKFSCKIKRPNYSKREFIIKYPKIITDKNFYDMLRDYLIEQYDFNLKEYTTEEMSLLDTCVLFSILHEFGHIADYITRLNNGGDLVNRAELDELSKYWEVSKIPNIKARFTAYRNIDNEAHADEYAMMFMERYKIELQKIMKRA